MPQRIHPIAVPEGIYARVVEPRAGYIEEAISRALQQAGEHGSVFLVFNGTSVCVTAGEDVNAVSKRWQAHREAYQAQREG